MRKHPLWHEMYRWLCSSRARLCGSVSRVLKIVPSGVWFRVWITSCGISAADFDVWGDGFSPTTGAEPLPESVDVG